MRRPGFGTCALLIGALLRLAAPGSGLAQQPARATASAAGVRTQLLQAVPRWDATVLRVTAPADWTTGLSFSGIFSAMGDQKALPSDLPANAQQVQLGESSIRLTRSLGRIRYVNGDRTWSPDTDARTRPVDSPQAVGVVIAALRELRLPANELGPPAVVTQMGVGGSTGSKVATDTIELYRIVTVARLMNHLLVENSRALAAVTHRGAIQRLSTQWPPFRLLTNLTLRERNAVINEALGQIMQQQPDGRVTLTARLVYVPRGVDDGDVWYVPAVSIAVTATETPFIVTVPVAR